MPTSRTRVTVALHCFEEFINLGAVCIHTRNTFITSSPR